MRFFQNRYSCFLLLLIVCLLIPGVTAWTVQKMAVKPSNGPLSPGTPVTVSYTVNFDAWIDGETFDSQHTLDMYTDLSDAQWTATLINKEDEDNPVTTKLESKKGIRYRIDGWTLSYRSGKLELDMTLSGKAPNVTQAQEKTIIRVQELDEVAETVSGAIKVVKYQIALPTTATTVRTQTPTSTPLPTTMSVPPTQVPIITTLPTVKQTYSPGPGPAMVFGTILIAGIIAGSVWSKKGR